MRSYLDHNATSPLRPAAKAAMIAALDAGGNASSVHAEGRAARKILDDARDAIAEALGVIAPMVVFTSGGTEANNLAIKGVAAERIIVSAIEHPAAIEAARATGKPVETIAVDAAGAVIPESLASLLANGPKALVSVMLANNETGIIQPVRELAAIAHEHGALFHTDAVQGLGKIPVNFGLVGADLMTVTAHKLGGPVGAGALVVRDGLPLEPLLHGGGQELRRRPGTENAAAAAGFAAALAEPRMDVAALRDELEAGLGDRRRGSRAPAQYDLLLCPRHQGRNPAHEFRSRRHRRLLGLGLLLRQGLALPCARRHGHRRNRGPREPGMEFDAGGCGPLPRRLP
jgi:cysteine desulfurase